MTHNPLFFVALFLGVAAVVVVVYACLSAPEGYEDEKGFHAQPPSCPERDVTAKHARDDPSMPKFPTAPWTGAVRRGRHPVPPRRFASGVL